MTPASRHTAAWIAVVAFLYVAAAQLGLRLDAVSGFASLVWPASGIALAAILLGGSRLWPAVAIGAFVANAMAGAPIATSLGIAFGNTSAAVIGAAMLRRVPGFDESLERVRDVVALILLASVGSTLVSATVGVAVLWVSGIVAAGAVGDTWRAWWLGDTIGDLVVAPLILVWSRRPSRESASTIAGAIGLGVVVIAVTLIVFGTPQAAANIVHGREYMLFPPLMWAALRYGTKGSVTAVAVVMVLAVIRTATGYGPFIEGDLHESLFELQIFMGISTATFLVLGASISERRRAAAELVAARETAESANKAKAGFLAAVSHELRTPLNAITGYVDLLSLEVDGPLAPKQHTALSRISDSQRHLLRLIDDVLGFAQVEAGRLSLSLQPVLVRDALASVEPIVLPDIVRRRLTLDVEPCDGSLVVNADPDKLRQVLLNLVTNAMKFTDSPGVVTIAAAEDGTRVAIYVTDTGIGIPEDQQASVFKPFFQVDQRATRRHGGVGLGLSIVRELVIAMNGEVSLQSTPGKGTRVSVWLPKM
jgi:signal transduction histidine kinase